MGKLSLLARIFKISEESAKAIRIGGVAGIGSFFTFEWITGGGLINSASGMLGISEMASSIVISATVLGVVGIVLYGLYLRMTRKSGRR